MVEVYLGVDPKQWLIGEVLRYSLLKRTKAKVNFHNLALLDLKEPLKTPTPSFSRWFIPYFQNYQGKAIYLDLATLVLDDIETLWNTPFQDFGALACPIQGERGEKSVGFKTNVMLLDCSKLTHWKPSVWLTVSFQNPASVEKTMRAMPGGLSAKDFSPLPEEWNQEEGKREEGAESKAKILHFKNPLTYPWLSEQNPHKALFLKELREAIEHQQIPLAAILLEMEAKRIYPKLLEEMMAI